VPAILARIKAPKFPARDFPITNFGAVADGKTDSTEAIRKAIAACNSAGGGRVVVPAGVFLTGAIHLKSNVNLFVSEGATLKFSTDPEKYLPVLQKIDFAGATGRISFDDKGDRKDAEMTIFTMKGGKLLPVAIIKGGKTVKYEDFIAQAAAPAADAAKK